jgi:hypothetical protein
VYFYNPIISAPNNFRKKLWKETKMNTNPYANYRSDMNMGAITEEFDLGSKCKALKGKTIKIKKLVPKDDGTQSLRDVTLFDGSQDMSQSDIDPNQQFNLDLNLNSELQNFDPNVTFQFPSKKPQKFVDHNH